MTHSAALMVVMMRIADQIEDLEVQIDYVRRTAGSESHVAKLQHMMQECMEALEMAWDSWNESLRKEQLEAV